MSETPLYLVRHSKAGERRHWEGEDRLRPLSRSGRRQADALVGVFEGRPVTRVLSSPYERCVETVRPLAHERGLRVEEVGGLSEGASLDGVLELIGSLRAEAAVLCSHGDVIPMIVEYHVDRGMRLEGSSGWKKGSLWILERSNGEFRAARYVPPPA
jgi:8-oxo-dGTP diphosphatase